MSSARVVVALTALVVLVIGALAFRGPLLRDRVPIASTGAPQPFSQRTPIELAPGKQLCASEILLEPRGRVAEFVLDQGPTASPALVFKASAVPEYSAPDVRVPGGIVGGSAVDVKFRPPRSPVVGRVCVRNAGRTKAMFVGTAELRTQTGLRTGIDGEEIPTDVALTFYEDRKVSALGFLPRAAEYAASLRGFLGAAGVVWALLVLCAIGVPLAVLFALYRALR